MAVTTKDIVKAAAAFHDGALDIERELKAKLTAASDNKGLSVDEWFTARRHAYIYAAGRYEGLAMTTRLDFNGLIERSKED